MENQNPQLKNLNRASWRSKCRKDLAQHIREKIGIHLKPSEVRLKSTEELQYIWKIDDPSLEPLFDKHLSKHSVGAYMQLSQEVGQSFHAVRHQGIMQRPSNTVLDAQYQQIKGENAQLLERLHLAEKDRAGLELARAKAEDEVQAHKAMIQESMHLHQQDIQYWMTVAAYYRTNFTRCVDSLRQLIVFAQTVESEASELLSE
ncbi:hypothetical protein BDV37DRAFT_289421 [Aspergillus pseudonomiae]|uniref:Uncharacterized protein n=1 Tax=Aspergillus pseudonomiae TaxID=1506151 RepID=A0A5N7CTE5_9EURO|nr:uncharacterized protein BDV37DRAFT_289421 [Aspergillus pseudonomiae]KAE8397424.1 hypothetical protein BDV37DRAFT_289421 [Aspergillus pseudonomiae]